MTATHRTLLTAGVLLLGGPAVAQPPAPTGFGGVAGGGVVGRPGVSPYLNLLRAGNPTYLNYYGLVRPQVAAQQEIQNLQGQVTTLNRGLQEAAELTVQDQNLPATGQPFGYFTHRGFFQTSRGYFMTGSSSGVAGFSSGAIVSNRGSTVTRGGGGRR